MATLTQKSTNLQVSCSNCPLARHLDRDRYLCTQSSTPSQVTRGHWEATAECREKIAENSRWVDADQEIEEYITMHAETIAPELPETRLEFYSTPDPDKYTCLSFRPDRVFPARYVVGKYIGTSAFYCTCPHHQNRQVRCKHIKELSDRFAAGTVGREPVRLEQKTFPRHLNPVFRAYIGDRSIAIVSASYYGIWGHSLPNGTHRWPTPQLAAQAAADEWWGSEEIVATQGREFAIAQMEEDLTRF